MQHFSYKSLVEIYELKIITAAYSNLSFAETFLISHVNRIAPPTTLTSKEITSNQKLIVQYLETKLNLIIQSFYSLNWLTSTAHTCSGCKKTHFWWISSTAPSTRIQNHVAKAVAWRDSKQAVPLGHLLPLIFQRQHIYDLCSKFRLR